MEVNKGNFLSHLELMTRSILDASFVSIDGEFTGLNNGQHPINALDSPQVRYLKLLKGGAIDFLLLQVGICTFHHDIETDSYVVRPFNIYVFPRPFGRAAPDSRFVCQTTSIDFLAAQDFDFNKVFKEGVSYLPSNVHQKLRDEMLQRHQEQRTATTVPRPVSSPQNGQAGHVEIPEEQKPFIEDLLVKIKSFKETESQKTLDLNPCNAFQRKLIFQTVSQKFSSELQADSASNEKKERFVRLTKADEEERQRLAAQRQATELEELDHALGFTEVIKTLAASSKLIVGHNMLLDLLHFLHHFVHPGLPQDYNEFKSLAHDTFPNVVDTKVLASNLPFKELVSDHALGPLRDRLTQAPFKPPTIRFDEGFDRYEKKGDSDGGPLHEAGFDAYVTGVCFATMLNYLGSFLDPPETCTSPSSRMLAPYLNKLHLMRSSADLSYLTLDGPDLDPPRDHVFHLTFPKDWRQIEIYQLFGGFGHIMISWIDETSAFITLKDKEARSQVTRSFCNGSVDASKNFKLIPFSDFLANFPLDGASSHSANRTPANRTPANRTSLPHPEPQATPSSSDRATPNTGKRKAAQAGLKQSSKTENGVSNTMKRLKRNKDPSTSQTMEEAPSSKTRYSWTKNAVTMAKTKAKEFLSRLTVSNLPPPGEREGESGAKVGTSEPEVEQEDLGEIVEEKEEGEIDSDETRTEPLPPGEDSPKKSPPPKEKAEKESRRRKGDQRSAISGKRMSQKKKDEMERAFEAKVKLFEEDDEWS